MITITKTQLPKEALREIGEFVLFQHNNNSGLDSKQVRELLKSMEELATYHIKIKLDQLRSG